MFLTSLGRIGRLNLANDQGLRKTLGHTYTRGNAVYLSLQHYDEAQHTYDHSKDSMLHLAIPAVLRGAADYGLGTVRAALGFDRNVAQTLGAFLGGRRGSGLVLVHAGHQSIDWSHHEEIHGGGDEQERDDLIDEIADVAAPMTTPTAMSTTLPRRMNFLKPSSMSALPNSKVADTLKRCRGSVKDMWTWRERTCGIRWNDERRWISRPQMSQAASASPRVAKNRKNCSTRVTIKALRTRSFTPTRESERPSRLWVT